MTQVLYLKPDATGKQREVRIIRSWQDAKGSQIYLHADGVYGYKDGSPVQKEAEFDIIGDPIQKRLALKWWKAKGRQMAQDYYAEREAELEARQEAQVPVVLGDASNLDAALYRRRKGKAGKWSDAATWYTWFQARPEWWGHAALIEIAGHRYEMVALEDGADEDPDAAADEPKSAAQAGGF